ncbi:MAG: hypothetical protein O3C28_06120 [Proteobacteria bacterium]|nr:hypothetical protein [Pseudomonadota bacterium]
MRTNSEHHGEPIKRLLAQRYGDGSIYLPKSANQGLLRDAVDKGLVSEDGYLTRKGRNFLAQADPATSVGK